MKKKVILGISALVTVSVILPARLLRLRRLR